MSKDLEKEYRALMDSEAPNLWARIEAGLEEKEKPAGRKRHRIKLWAGLAAACACAAVCIPVMKSCLPLSGGATYTAEPARNDTVSIECVPQAAALPAEGAESAAEAVQENSVRSAAENGEDTCMLEDSDAVSSGSMDNGAGALAGALQENNSFVVTAEILDIDLRLNSGIVYLAKVVSSEDEAVQAGSEIKIFRSALAAEGMITLEQSRTYELTLMKEAAQGEEEVPSYTLQSAAKP